MDPASKFTGFESEIHAAEMDVMALAREYGCIAVIDDGIAREIGEMCNVNVQQDILPDLSSNTAWFVKQARIRRKDG